MKPVTKKKRVAIIGTNGLPNRYGGFETLADNLTRELNKQFDFTVYCKRTEKSKRLRYYNNARLIYIPFKANGFQGVLYDLISLFHAWFTNDVLLYLGPVLGFILPLNFLFKKKIIVNFGGMEWEREKYSFLEKQYLKLDYKISALCAKYNVTDNTILSQKIKEISDREAVVIRYGGDHVKRTNSHPSLIKKKHPFITEKYVVSVSRAQEDNNLHLLLEAFESIDNLKLVLISNWEVSEYGRNLKKKYGDSKNSILLDAIYDQTELNLIRRNAFLYIHSHSKCGTAPSLVEAICLNLPILSFDVPTNRETTRNSALYFKNTSELIEILSNLETKVLDKIKDNLSILGSTEYTWKKISDQYSHLFNGQMHY